MLVIHQGGFGLAVAQALLERCVSGRSLSIDDALSHRWEDERKDTFVALALGSLHPSRTRRLAQVLWERKLTHSVVMLSDQNLLIGPLVAPPDGPCLRCAMARSLSMFDTPQNARLESNRQLYMEHTGTAQIPGYLPSQVQMAAVKLLQHAGAAPEHRGRLTVISLNGSWSVHTRITALHGCTCRGNTLVSVAERWTAQLERDIEVARQI
ncbi:bacteriocin biosynthesis cyclodehydratase domain protein [Pseudomonas sp. 24 E 13]|jgi:hypothetical protein|uniref:Bacteriocin biosynthesis cyclodehydratase domain-containing protein n=1 Tax=Pseudomonas orientalis TaxID=76758 RepID=A0A4Q7D5G0_9PSED|nr:MULTISPECIES: hypothetical protein [Pseudomonas]POM09802.1 hypothetical protein CUU62_25795 [Pseudomonas sp. WP001]MBY8930834.1 hypothetical protein [Pseudomonas sp. Wu6]RZI31669.1 hypothetical protein EUX57_11555 [Pseudomonas orientalis]CRM31009.1 bacteriocin biosynthesis cyclodehydratase domain protein [Pseudomonas sp. 44 R 15]CRM80824.1 bacteriocin biosynthesis cyclodehydratase domain protein [Pseudomonas sp. 24 E 13]